MPTDQLSRTFAALADPTRRDLVARLTLGDATLTELAAHVHDEPPGRLEAPRRASEGRARHPRQRRPAPTRTSRDPPSLSPSPTGSRPTAGRPRSATSASTPSSPTSPTRRSTHPQEDSDDRHADRLLARRDRGRPEPPDHPHHPRLHRHARAAVPGAHRSHAVRALVRPERRHHEIDHWDCRYGRELGVLEQARRRVVLVPRLLPRDQPDPSRPDLHVRRLARRRLAGDAHHHRPGRRPYPPDRQSLVDSFESRDQWLESGMETGVNDGYAKLDTLLLNHEI